MKFRESLWKACIVGALLSALGNSIFFVISDPSIAYMIPAQPGSTEMIPLDLSRVVFLSIIPAIVACGLFAALKRFTKRPMTIFYAISLVFLFVSFVGPFSIPIDISANVSLSIMHVISGFTIVWALTGFRRD